MFEVIVLAVLGLVALLFSSVHDIRERLVSNWLVFGLAISALVFRFFYSLFNQNFSFFYQGLVGLGVFFALAMLFYYSRLFGGLGDAKLLIALGVILPFFSHFRSNLELFVVFVLGFLIIGEIYSLLIVFFTSLFHFKKFKKEFSSFFKEKRLMLFPFLLLGLIFVVIGFLTNFIFYYPWFSFDPFIFFGCFIIIISLLFVYLKSLERVAFVKQILCSKLVEGDILYSDVILGKNRIKASTFGLTSSEIALLLRSKKKKVTLLTGTPFVPVFLLAFLFLLYYVFLWKPFW